MSSFKDIIVRSSRNVIYNSKFVLLFFGTNLAFAFILSTPIYYMLTDNLGHSFLSKELLGKFDVIWYLQLRSLYENNFNAIPIVLYSITGAYALVQTFYWGGLVSIFNTPKKNHMVDFFYGGVKYWFRFTKILIISILFYALAFKLNDFIGYLITEIFKYHETVIYEFVFRILRFIFLILLIGIISIISDYSKIAMAVDDSHNVFKKILDALIFIKRNFYKVFTIYFLVAVIGAVGVLIYNLLGTFIPEQPVYFLVITIIVQQMLIVFRFMVRMLFCASEVMIYKENSADIVDVEANEV